MPLIAPMSPKPRRIVVEVLVFEDMLLLDLAGVTQVFTAANDITTGSGAAAVYDVKVVAPGGTSVRSTSGITVGTSPLSDPSDDVDTLIIIGGQGVRRASEMPAVIDWIKSRSIVARRVASVCTGAFLLGAAGLLNERNAVTHWAFCGELAELYPLAKVDADPIFIRDGDVWTSAGVTACIDLCLAFVESDLGRSHALAVARHLVVFLKRPGGQSQFSATLSLQTTDDRFADLHEWLTDHLDAKITLRDLAKHVAMSERTFLRRYREATGLTPQRAIERLRVETARHMLSETPSSAKLVAARCGFGSEETMRRSFIRVLGVNPQDYRERFGEG